MLTIFSKSYRHLVLAPTVLFCLAGPANASILFSDAFNEPSDLSSWTAGGGIIVATPDGTSALSFNRTWGGGDIFTNEAYTSSTGSFTLSFDYLTNCNYTSGCGAFIATTTSAVRSIDSAHPGWILADTAYKGSQQFFGANGIWENVSYTFAGTNLYLALEDFASSPHAAAGSFFIKDLVLTDNSNGLAVGTLTTIGLPASTQQLSAVPVPASVFMFASGLLGFAFSLKKKANS